MTLEEALQEIERLKGENATLTANQSNQNSYITKLETTNKALEKKVAEIQATAAAAPQAPGIDSKFVKMMRGTVVSGLKKDAKEIIVANVGLEIYGALEKDYEAFLDEYMTDENMSEGYMADSFNLVLGRAMADKNHDVHKVIGKVQEENNTPPANSNPITKVAPITPPPVMTNEDTGAGQPDITPERTNVPNTKTAFKGLKERMFNAQNSLYR